MAKKKFPDFLYADEAIDKESCPDIYLKSDCIEYGNSSDVADDDSIVYGLYKFIGTVTMTKKTDVIFTENKK